MIDGANVERMARYNRWQNENLYSAADRLSETEWRRVRGAFWGSIHKTFNHLLWGDQKWMSQLTGSARPPVGIADTGSLCADWTALKAERVRFDQTIIDWADTIAPSWLAAEMTHHSLAVQRDVTEPHWVPVTHLFNHRTHHRGQVHCMPTQAGERPADTDLPFMPE
jgi:uncharacterized damage-inducible protein DinB